MKLNEKIYNCRKKSGMSQEELAEKLGVSRQSISKWETGAAQPELDKLPAISKLFGVTCDWLLNDDEGDACDGITGDNTDENDAACENLSDSKGHNEGINSIPAFLRSMFLKYGWIYGVYVAVGGAFFTFIGFIAKFISDKILSDSFGEFGGEAEIIFDNAANLTEQEMEIIKNSLASQDMFSGIYNPINTAEPFNPVGIMGTFIMILGVIIMIAGIITAVMLKRYGNNHKQ